MQIMGMDCMEMYIGADESWYAYDGVILLS